MPVATSHACAPCDWCPTTSTIIAAAAHSRHGRHPGSRVRRARRLGHGTRPAHRRRPARREPLCAGGPEELAGREEAAESAPRSDQERAVGRAAECRLFVFVAPRAGEPAAAREVPVARLHRGCVQLPPPAAGADGQCQEEGESSIMGYAARICRESTTADEPQTTSQANPPSSPPSSAASCP